MKFWKTIERNREKKMQIEIPNTTMYEEIKKLFTEDNDIKIDEKGGTEYKTTINEHLKIDEKTRISIKWG